MKNIYIIDDKSATSAPVVKMTCDCGWIEKTFADRNAVEKAEHHIRTKHTHGLVHYNGLVTKV